MLSSPESWVPVSRESPFSLANIPFGIISTPSDDTHRPAIAIGDFALDLKAFAIDNGFSQLNTPDFDVSAFSETTLNTFAALRQPVHRSVREYLQDVLSSATRYPDVLKNNEELRSKAMVPLSDTTNHLPLAIGDYTDFYAGKNHAYNVGVLFRGPSNALQPNYTHLPVAYHGRASSVVVSGTSIRRPWGQVLEDPTKGTPSFIPSKKLDLELELAMFVCKENKLGEPVPVHIASEYIFGYVLMIDWSARDIQAWEYVPLGPFLSKNLGTSISPWVVLSDAMEPFKRSGITNETPILPYLQEDSGATVLDISLEVDVVSSSGHATTISRTNACNLLWSWPQMIAHHTVTGCNLRTGDLLGSGTISGAEAGREGSLLEQTFGGKSPIKLADGSSRTFLEDGDTLLIRGFAGADGARVGFGSCFGKILPALPLFKH